MVSCWTSETVGKISFPSHSNRIMTIEFSFIAYVSVYECVCECVCVFREMFIYISHRHDRRFFLFHPVLFLANINLNGLISAAHSEPFTKILRLAMRRCLYCCAHVRIDLPTMEMASTSSFWYNAGISAGYCRFLWPQTNHGLWP